MLIRKLKGAAGAEQRCVKVVVVAPKGADAFVRRVEELTPPEARGAQLKVANMRPKEVPVVWTLTSFDFRLSAPGALPVIQVFLAGHEGTLLQGMERRLKDRLYLGVDGILCLAENAATLEKFAPLIAGDLARLRTKGLNPPCIFAAPLPESGRPTFTTAADTELVFTDWRESPMELLQSLMAKIAAAPGNRPQ